MKTEEVFKTKRVACTIAVHWIQAEIIHGLQSGHINLQRDSLRAIGEMIGLKNEPQKIKHHLGSLVKLGVIDIVNNQYIYKK